MPKTHYRHLSDEDRLTITTMGMAGHSEPEIAKKLQRSRSTIHRERRRNACNDGKYRRRKATLRAAARRNLASRRPHYTKRQWRKIDRLLIEDWSPEQIAKTLKVKRTMQISHQSIYRHV